MTAKGCGLTSAMLKQQGWSGGQGRTQLARMAFPRGGGGETTVEGRRRVALLGSVHAIREAISMQLGAAAGGSAWLDALPPRSSMQVLTTAPFPSLALLGSMPTEDSTHQAYHAAGGGK